MAGVVDGGPRHASGSVTGAVTVTVAVMGNPNAGKTAIFNRLTGLSQKVGNYPGVTVERKEGICAVGGVSLRVLDLPGTYSLAAHSPDEVVAVDVLLGHQPGEVCPDLVLQVIDASNLERNLYLFSQVLELGVPVVIALNMMDIALSRGLRIDVSRLSEQLGVPVVPVEGHRGAGMDALRRVLTEVAREIGLPERTGKTGAPVSPIVMDAFSEPLEALRRDLAPEIASRSGREPRTAEVLRALIDRGGHAEARWIGLLGESVRETLEGARQRVGVCMPLATYEAGQRYGWIHERTKDCVIREKPQETSLSERVDRILTHRVLGFVIFGLLMLGVFQSIFVGARPLMEGIESLFSLLQGEVDAWLPEGALRSLLVDGVIAGVGMVAMFLPQILILFLFIGILEDCGYMARAAFLMDKIMSKCGLSGKSFVPMLSGFACAVPGILAARVIQDRRDRLATMLVTPLMSCSARLPVYSVFIGTFIAAKPVLGGLVDLQGLTLFGLYFLGIFVAIAVAWLLRRTLLRGARPPFVLELPSYKLPSAFGVILRLKGRAQEFLVRAGTVILAIAVIVWALAYFPRSSDIGARFDAERARVALEVPESEQRVRRLQRLDSQEASAYLGNSYFGQMGKLVEPVFRPLGWDWRIAMAALASFPAREVFISTLGTILHLGEEAESDSGSLREGLRRATRGGGPGSPDGEPPEQPLFTLPVALSVLVFFALCCQCGATVVTLGREAGSWRWAAFGFGYMTVLAYVGAWATYRLGLLWLSG